MSYFKNQKKIYILIFIVIFALHLIEVGCESARKKKKEAKVKGSV